MKEREVAIVGQYLLRSLTVAMHQLGITTDPKGRWHFEWELPSAGVLRLNWLGKDMPRTEISVPLETPQDERAPFDPVEP